MNQAIRKKLYLVSLAVATTAFIPLTTISCGATVDTELMFSKLNMWIKDEKMIPVITFKNNQEVTNLNITKLDFTNFEKKELDYDLKWIVQEDKIEDNDKKQEVINDINNMINFEIKTEFSHFYLPKLNEDGEAPVYFTIELVNAGGRGVNKKQDFRFLFKDLARFNKWKVQNLKADELKTLIKVKLEQTPSLVANLSNIISKYFFDNPSLVATTSGKKTVTIDQWILDKISEEIIRSNKYFNDQHNEQNLFILNTVDQKLDNVSGKINNFELTLQISTSAKKTNDAAIDFKIPFIVK